MPPAPIFFRLHAQLEFPIGPRQQRHVHQAQKERRQQKGGEAEANRQLVGALLSGARLKGIQGGPRDGPHATTCPSCLGSGLRPICAQCQEELSVGCLRPLPLPPLPLLAARTAGLCARVRAHVPVCLPACPGPWPPPHAGISVRKLGFHKTRGSAVPEGELGGGESEGEVDESDRRAAEAARGGLGPGARWLGGSGGAWAPAWSGVCRW